MQGSTALDQASHTSQELQAWQSEARRRMSTNFGGDIEGGKRNATAEMFEYAVADSLKEVPNEPESLAGLKLEVRSSATFSLACAWAASTAVASSSLACVAERAALHVCSAGAMLQLL